MANAIASAIANAKQNRSNLLPACFGCSRQQPASMQRAARRYATAKALGNGYPMGYPMGYPSRITGGVT